MIKDANIKMKNNKDQDLFIAQNIEDQFRSVTYMFLIKKNAFF